MSETTSIGTCLLCGGSFDRKVMSRHLKTCGLPEPSGEPNDEGYHLFVEGRYQPAYWLHLAISPDALLGDLDDFLRHTWLECCGHLSAFFIQGEQYCSSGLEDAEGPGMETPVSEVVLPGKTFLYEYDFGSTTSLKLKVIRTREVSPNQNEVELLAQNDAPHIPCDKCGEEDATQICMECGGEGESWFCESCVEDHDCDPEYLLPVANSPRAGVCAYSG